MDLVRDFVNDPNDSLWSLTRKQAKVNLAQEKFVEDTKALTDLLTITTVGGTAAYALNTDTIDLYRVTHKNIPLIRTSKSELDFLTGVDWTLTNGTPTRFYIDYTSTTKNINLYPNPQSSDAGANLIVEYVKLPPTMSTDIASPFNSQVLLNLYSESIAYYAAYQFLKASPNPADWQKGDQYKIMYDAQVSNCQEIFKRLNRVKPTRFRGGRYFKGMQ